MCRPSRVWSRARRGWWFAARPTTTNPSQRWRSSWQTDKHVGHLTYVRVYSGVAKTGDQVLNSATGRKSRIGRLLQMHANKRQDIDEIHAGDIAAAVGLKGVATGHTLCKPRHPVLLEPIEFPIR